MKRFGGWLLMEPPLDGLEKNNIPGKDIRDLLNRGSSFIAIGWIRRGLNPSGDELDSFTFYPCLDSIHKTNPAIHRILRTMTRKILFADPPKAPE